MKKTLVYGTATAAVVLALGSSIAVTQCGRNIETVYGPPPIQDNDDPIEDVYGPPIAPEEDDEAIETVYGPPPEYEDEPIEDVYGPPVEYESDVIVEDSGDTETEAVQPALYGPPVSG